jgi:integrin beta 3
LEAVIARAEELALRLHAVEERMEKIHDGRDGLPGVPGRDGAPGERGPAGERGRDGIDGTLETLTIMKVDDHTFKFATSTGASLGEFSLDNVLDYGVFVDGKTYEKFAGVTHAGSYWIAQVKTAARPGNGSTDWRLAVKRGADGRDGKIGPAGPVGPKGSPGSPGRDFS